MTIPELDLGDPAVLADPLAAYGRAREAGPVARLGVPGFGTMWVVTRHDGARAMLSDPRFAPAAASYQRPDVPARCLPYLRTMQEMDGSEHARLRRLVSPAFNPRRAAGFRDRIAAIVDALLDRLPVEGGEVDLLAGFAGPLPMEVICEIVGVPEADRPRWREWGAAVVAGHGAAFAEAIPAIIDGAKEVVARRRVEPADDVVTDLLDTDLDETALVTFVWHLVLAGQTPTNLVANAVDTLFAHPGQRAAFAATGAGVDELTRWCGPQLLTIPRFATEDVDLYGVPVAKGEPVTAALGAANRDPRVFADPERLDLDRPNAAAHLAYAHGPHFCLGAPLARVQTEVALTTLLRRFPDLSPAGQPRRVPDPGTLRLLSLPVRLHG
jgi:cytochrome P450